MEAGIRWAFRFGSWKPKEEEWETALESVQTEEIQRLRKYVFKKDCKSTMAGRLLLRRAVHTELNIPWADIELARTQHGKPYLSNQAPDGQTLSVNVSHHGHYTVLAASQTYQVGIDVIKIEWPRGTQPVERLFGLMSDHFTEHEWRTIHNQPDEWDQLSMFYRHWSLKESYVKAVGVGLNMELRRLEFHTDSELQCGRCVRDTRLYLDGSLQHNWCFEETMLDSCHSVATALCSPDNRPFTSEVLNTKTKFRKMSISHLLEHAQPLGHDIPTGSYDAFKNLKEKPGKM